MLHTQAGSDSEDDEWQKKDKVQFGEENENVPAFNLKRKHWAEQEEMAKKKAKTTSGPAAAVGTAHAPPSFTQNLANDRLKKLFMKQVRSLPSLTLLFASLASSSHENFLFSRLFVSS